MHDKCIYRESQERCQRGDSRRSRALLDALEGLVDPAFGVWIPQPSARWQQVEVGRLRFTAVRTENSFRLEDFVSHSYIGGPETGLSLA